jgi:predicted ribosomally synthesized peptide with nif11-like leader
MSVESAELFIKRMKSDKEFAEKINAFKSMEEAKRYIASQGFEFTMEDLGKCRQELSDDELDKVVAGEKCNLPTCEVGTTYNWYPDCPDDIIMYL